MLAFGLLLLLLRSLTRRNFALSLTNTDFQLGCLIGSAVTTGNNDDDDSSPSAFGAVDSLVIAVMDNG